MSYARERARNLAEFATNKRSRPGAAGGTAERGVTLRYTVYVPAADSAAEHILIEGSAIVGTELPAEVPTADRPAERRVMIDYEGAAFGQFDSYAEKLLHAAGRHAARYPTTARMWCPREELLPVGQYDLATERLEVHDSEKLGAWIGDEAVTELQVAA